MNKAELVEAMAKESKLTKKESEAALNAFVTCVTKALKKSDKVVLVGFGTFDVAKRKARKGVNPQTRKPIDIPACKAPKFRAGSILKDAVNK